MQEEGFQQVYLRGTTGGDAPEDRPKQFCFDTPESLLDFVTRKWYKRWLTIDVASERTVDVFAKRPFFFLISVDAPALVRWEREKKKYDISHAGALRPPR